MFVGNITYDNADIDSQFKDIRDEDIIVTVISDYIILDKSRNGGLNTNKRSLKRGEQYRYGVVFYDKLNRKSSVRWIKD